jgi:hypothetical protein
MLVQPSCDGFSIFAKAVSSDLAVLLGPRSRLRNRSIWHGESMIGWPVAGNRNRPETGSHSEPWTLDTARSPALWLSSTV